jgi:hypothetical protein
MPNSQSAKRQQKSPKTSQKHINAERTNKLLQALCIAANLPYVNGSIHTRNAAKLQATCKNMKLRMDTPPHRYAISRMAYRNL